MWYFVIDNTHIPLQSFDDFVWLFTGLQLSLTDWIQNTVKEQWMEAADTSTIKMTFPVGHLDYYMSIVIILFQVGL